MRLKQIQLAGFKSFVDPTKVPFPSDLVAVLGPNGCGKSNIIDAVRWVMGESSAKNLRGEAMADVIFNGSAQRKPVGQASIELIFDNSMGRLGGQFGQYAEISVRRLLNRDGDSQYFLNGSRCRRRDISDLFAGTGLGPRSYAIIEQGTISRLVESKPHELRVFVEEAAGIVKYKERRRETQLRIEHSQQNLSRLDDIRHELAESLHLLSEQAEQARQFKALREQERLTRQQLDSLRWHQQNQQEQQLKQQYQSKQLELDQCQTQLVAYSQQMQQLKLMRQALQDELATHQSHFYQLSADLARSEQQQTGLLQARSRLQQSQLQLQQQTQRDAEQQQQDSLRLDAVQQAQQQLLPELAACQQQQASLAADLERAQAKYEQQRLAQQQGQLQRQQWQSARQLALSQAQSLQKQLLELEQQQQQVLTRLQALPAETQRDAELAELVWQLEQSQLEQFELEQAGQQAQQAGQQAEQQQQQLAEQLAQSRASLAELQGRQSALALLLQESAPLACIQDWLAACEPPARELATELQVAEAWLPVLDWLLGSRAQAYLARAPSLSCPEQAFALIDSEQVWQPEVPSPDLPWLVSLIQCPVSLWPWLFGIKAALTEPQAWQARAALRAGESILTPSGLWLGPNWLQRLQPAQERPGLLALSQQRQQLQAAIEPLQQSLQQLTPALQQAQQQRQQAWQQVQQSQQQLASLQVQHGKLQAELSRLQQQAQHQAQQRQFGQQQLSELALRQADLREERQIFELEAAGIEQQLNALDLTPIAPDLALECQALQQQLQQCQQQCQQLLLTQARQQSQIEAAELAGQRLALQQQQTRQQLEDIAIELWQSEAPLQQLAEQLQQQLAQRLLAEQQLTLSRQALGEQDERLRQFDVLQLEAQQQQESLQQAMQQLQLAQAGCQLKQEHGLNQLQQAGLELLAWSQLENLQESSLQAQLQALSRQLAKLGDINLTAIEQFEQQSQRKDYLDRQNQDLTDALALLNEAIRKIDRETRQRFLQTFEQINAGLQRLFPKVFGGGEAWLELTDEDLLETGIRIMARPPGKRNSSIQLLSGGEKALTAMSLVFAIFELNPAPFCMLDEVDAPLDDVNVGRFCQLVQSMNDRVQFIYITHNKVAMEMAQHLIGVTMQEPGVSRLVSVDIEQAVQLAAS